MKKDQEIDTSSLVHDISHLSKRTPKNGGGTERAWYLLWEAADRCLLMVGHSCGSNVLSLRVVSKHIKVNFVSKVTRANQIS